MGNRTSIAQARSLDAQLFGTSIDALTARTLVVEGTEKRTVAIYQHPSASARFIIDILLAAPSFLELLMLTALAGGMREQEGQR